MMYKAGTLRTNKWLIALLAFVVLGVLFGTLPMPGGIDWETFYGAARRIWTGEPLYGELVSEHSHFYNPPWMAVILAPLGLLPLNWGQAILSAATFVLIAMVMQLWQAGPIRLALALLSPPMLYTMLHGEIDGLVLAGVLLPREWWALVALTKPQVTIGLLFGIPRKRWRAAAVITAAILAGSLLWFGLWPLELLRQPRTLIGETWNLWLGLWPFQVPAGIALILMSLKHRDERLLLAASPLLSPYATTSSLLGPWIAASLYLKDWQAAVVWASWWAAVAYRALGF
jgi:hypothetical protein